MAPLALFAALLLLLGSPSSSSSLTDVTPLLVCGGSNNRQMTSSERIKNFLDCLRDQGHDEELLAELKRSFEGQSASLTPPLSGCPPGGLSDEKGRFPYCSGMTDLQCRTLILVLESLLNAPEAYKSSGGGSLEKSRREPLANSRENPDDQRIQADLMNVILDRFNDVLDDYKQWRNDHGDRTKRSETDSYAILTESEAGERRNNVSKSSSDGKAGSPETENQSKPEVPKSKHPRALRMRRQLPPNLPFKLPDKLTPEMQAVVEGYLAWREKNGYGKMNGRWG